MNQTAFTFGAVAVAFLIFVVINGDLAKWLGVFGFAGSPTQSAATSGTGATPATSGTGATPTAADIGAPGLATLPALPALQGAPVGSGGLT